MITLTKRQWIGGGIALGIPILVAVIVLSIPKHNAIPTREQKSLDSMRVTQKAYEVSRDTLIQHETLFVRRVDTLVKHATQIITETNIIHQQADSLALVAQQSHDTASKWKAAYDARTNEADSLRSAYMLTFAAETTEHRAHLLADARADAADMRVTALNDLNERLAKDVQNATQCKFLWMRCPSRTTIAVSSFLIGGSIGLLARSRVP